MKYAVIFSIQLLIVFFLSESAQCRKIKKSSSSDGDTEIFLRKVAQMILDKGRRQGAAPKFTAKDISLLLRESTNREPVEDLHKVEEIQLQDHQAPLVETELVSALAHKKSALFDKPYVETQGRNDFLVLQPAFRDPFVTIIPNAMYYNVEKGCVNWLDDCNLHGMKARLLREVRSPYKK